jgi:Peptidase family M1 domain
MQKSILVAIGLVVGVASFAQSNRWQQRIKYNINVELIDKENKLIGTEHIDYNNNSDDSLTKLFFHAYWNAFTPNSCMDMRSRELGKIAVRQDKAGNNVYDWDGRVRDRIVKLSKDEEGGQQIKSVIINGKKQQLIFHETVVEVVLDKAIAAKSVTKILVDFEAKVPVQIRRSGRNNIDGVMFSMSQWYPKMVEYDYQGWNANPYVAREFYGVWGDYTVAISLPKKYTVAATGTLINANEIGKGYANTNTVKQNNLPNNIWNFKGENIHDFVWAADTGYVHLSKKIREGLTLHTFYKPSNASADSAWQNINWAAEKVLPFIEKNFGAYPYPQYSFIQGGDGGMEYAMATLLRGSGLGTVFHEWMHSWYQHILGTNESLFAWMDEGFTTYAENLISAYYDENWASKSPFVNADTKAMNQKMFQAEIAKLPKWQSGDYNAYFSLAKSGFEEPLTTHADHFNTNYGYSLAAYTKGATFINQLGYIIGDSARDKTLLEYYKQWKFKHPNANDFIRIAEKVSGIALQWYKEYWVYSTKTIDYKIGNIETDSISGNSKINLLRVGKIPMPIDVEIVYKDGSQQKFTIPLNLMYGSKTKENNNNFIVLPEWKWTHTEYSFIIDKKITDIKSIEIDPTQRLADINKSNNKIVIPN